MKKVFAFLGGDHKCGTSMISQSVAESVASRLKDLKVLLIHAEKDENNIFSPNVGESLENIRPYLTERLIDMGEIASKSRYKDNLYIIGGNSKPGSSGSFSPSMSEYLLSAASAIFDIVICDSGADVENGMSIGSLFSANNIYLVSTSSEATLKKEEFAMSFYRKLNLPISKIIINKYSKRKVNSVELICERLGFVKDDMFVISQSENGDRAEQEERSIYSMKDYKFKREIDKVADDLVRRIGYGEFQF